MKIYIECSGDPIVGIEGQCATLEMDINEAHKESVRHTLEEAFGMIWDDMPVYVYFPDGGKAW